MTFVILKAIGYLFLIFMGYFLKKIGKFQQRDKDVLGVILMYIALPCAFVANFRHFEMRSSLFLFFLIGLFVNLILMLVGKVLARKKSPEDRAEYMIQSSGYNIGAFTTPFVGSVMDPFGTVVSSIFDIGNSIMGIGMIFPLANREVSEEKGDFLEQVRFILKKLFNSVPFDTYLVMLVISLLGIRLPAEVSDVAQILGAPAIIITMIMIGIAIEIQVSKDDLIDIIRILLIRYLGAIVIMILIAKLSFLGSVEKQALCYCVCAPPTSISPTYAMLCGSKSTVYGAVSSISIIISLGLFIAITGIAGI